MTNVALEINNCLLPQMLVSIIIPVYNRPRLTRQTFETLIATLANTDVPYEVIVVDHASDIETRQVIARYSDMTLLRLETNKGVGYGKNQGVKAARGTHLYISDNDMYFLPGWLDALVATYDAFDLVKLLGAFCHPYHNHAQYQTCGTLTFEQTEQLVGSSWYLDRNTWESYGPLLEGGAIGDDDVEFVRRLTGDGHMVGTIYPYRVIHCGYNNSDGNTTPGVDKMTNLSHHAISRMPDDLIML